MKTAGDFESLFANPPWSPCAGESLVCWARGCQLGAGRIWPRVRRAALQNDLV